MASDQADQAYDINVPYQSLTGEYESKVKERTDFPDYLPVWEEGVWFDSNFPAVDYKDPALRADPTKPNLLTAAVTATPVTPRMGTILTGVKLADLSPAAKDELALLISERKFVLLRDQVDFFKTGPQFQVEWMEYFGKLSIQPASGAIKGFPQYHVIHRDNNEAEIEKFFQYQTTTTLWHNDVSFERQPPGYTLLGILACPKTGGDTVVADAGEAYRRLSPLFQEMLHQVKAIHTSEKIIGHTKASGGRVRCDPIETCHPVVRVHPVTGERLLFLNMEFLKRIVGLKNQEAEVVSSFVMDHLRSGHDFQARIQWEKNSVVMFDGRSTSHTATVDYDTTEHARHLFRLTAMAEVPIPVVKNNADEIIPQEASVFSISK